MGDGQTTGGIGDRCPGGHPHVSGIKLNRSVNDTDSGFGHYESNYLGNPSFFLEAVDSCLTVHKTSRSLSLLYSI